MTLCLRTSHYRFVYSFASGHQLVGTVIGDTYPNRPDMVFNLRSLRALCLSPQGSLMMSFDDVFGQFTLSNAEAILSASHSRKGSFFSINSRNGEACIYDSLTDQWVANGWDPDRWQIHEVSMLPSLRQSESTQASNLVSIWKSKAIA